MQLDVARGDALQKKLTFGLTLSMFLMAYDSFWGLSFFTSCYVTTRSSNRRKFNYFRHALVATGGRGSENGAQFEATIFGNRYLSSCFCTLYAI